MSAKVSFCEGSVIPLNSFGLADRKVSSALVALASSQASRVVSAS